MNIRSLSFDKIIDYLGLVFILFFIKYGLLTLDIDRLIVILSLPLILLILNKPFIGLCIAVFLDLWFSYVDLYSVPPRNYLIFYLTLTVILTLLLGQKIRVSQQSRKILLIALIFLACAVSINFLQEVPFGQSLYGVSGRLIAPLMIAICTMYFVNTEFKLKIFMYTLIFAMSISALVGILQFFNVEFFWKIRETMGISSDSRVGLQILERQRIPGLAYFAIPFSYQLGTIIPLLFGLILSKFTSSPERLHLWIALVLMTVALIFSLTRSAILGCIIGLGVVSYLARGKFQLSKLITIILIFLLIVLSSDVIKNRFLKPDEAALSRIPQTIVAAKIFFSNPMGIGLGQFQKYSVGYFKKLSHLSGASEILRTSSHNQFLNTTVYFGIPGLILLMLFYKRLFKSLFYLRRSFEEAFLKGVTIGLIGSFISYINTYFLTKPLKSY